MSHLTRFCLTLVLLFLPLTGSFAAYLEVTAPGSHQPRLSIAPPVALGGQADAPTSREIVDVLSFDLTLSGLFNVEAATEGQGQGGIRPGSFDFAPWDARGTEFLVKTGITLSGSNVTLECRLFDVVQRRELTAKRFTGSRKDLRRISHTFSDEILRAVTGERGPFTSKVAYVCAQGGGKEICLMDYDGHNMLRLTSSGSINLYPSFAPSGRELLFTSYKKGTPDLFRRDIQSGAEARVASSRGLNAYGSYSPDGSRIALTQSKDGNSEIYLISKEGKQLARLTDNRAIDITPSWSPDGRRIAFVSDRLGKPQVFVMDADGRNVRRLTTSGAYNVSPRWSPKGDRIAYSRQEGGGFQIYAIRPDGSEDTRLTSEGSNEHPSWSPDGRFITFSSNRAGKSSLFVMRADGTGQTRVSRGQGSDSNPAWSPFW